MQFYTTEKLSLTRELTPEGFLLCRGAVMTRTGELLYTRGETPIDPGPDNIAHIHRTEAEVFRPATIASANGKPVVNEHPTSDVTPDNWKRLAVGVILDCRRGKFPEDDLLLADLLITDKAAIKLIDEGKVELSCGYDADYEPDGEQPGHGYQSNILINHVALVASGRCGPRCSIADSAPDLEELKQMAKDTPLKALAARLSKAFKTQDADEFKKSLAHITGEEPESEPEEDGDGLHIHVHHHAKGSHDDDDGERHSRRHKDDDDSERHSRRHRDDDDADERRARRHKDDDDASEHRARRHRDDEGEEESEETDIVRRIEKIEETVAGMAAELKKLVGMEAEEEEEEEHYEDSDESEKEDLEEDPDSAYGEEKIKGATGDDDESEEEEDERKEHRKHKDGERRHRATDSIELGALDLEWRETRALAEILAPGLKFPTHDAASNPKRTVAAMCRVRREALSTAYRNGSRELIESVVGGKLRLQGMTCDAVASAFRSSAALRRAANRNKPSRAATAGGGGLGVAGRVATPADFNRMVASQWGAKYKTQH